MKVSKIALAVSALLISGSALAHGFISEPPSRDRLCQTQQNAECGQAQWEPQSVGESPKGFPKPGTPPDGELVSGNGGTAGIGKLLNAQDSTRWYKNKMQAGTNTFTWHFTAAHKTTDFKYFITKQDWDANKPLTRDAFELTPFCVVDGHGQIPAPSGADVTHTCQVPERNGYQVIYASWEIDDTGNSFYKTVDVEFDGGVPSEWSNSIGSITAHKDLKAGDNVKVRFFDTNGENTRLELVMDITSDKAGKKQNWPKALAEKINSAHKDIRAGSKNAKGEVNPSSDLNQIYTRAGSTLRSVVVETHSENESKASMTLSQIKESYPIVDGKAIVTFDVVAEGDLVVNTKVHGEDNSFRGFLSVTLKDGKKTLQVPVDANASGVYSVNVLGIPRGSDDMLMEDFKVNLTAPVSAGDAEFVYPQNIAKYKAGTTVLQPKTNKVYECKQGAVAGWCTIYSSSANHYEPGVGSAWQDAWNEIGDAKK